MVQLNDADILGAWVEEYENDPEYIAGDLATDVMEEVARTLKERGNTQTWLGQTMGVSRSQISSLFSATPNLTLLSIARIAVALGYKPKVLLNSQRYLIQSLEEPFNYEILEELKTSYAIDAANSGSFTKSGVDRNAAA